MPAQQRAAAGEVDALEHDVLRQLGRGLAQAVGRGRDDRRHVLLQRAAHLERREHDRLGPARRHLAAADLGLLLAGVGEAEPMASLTASAVRSPMATP